MLAVDDLDGSFGPDVDVARTSHELRASAGTGADNITRTKPKPVDGGDRRTVRMDHRSTGHRGPGWGAGRKRAGAAGDCRRRGDPHGGYRGARPTGMRALSHV